MAPQRWPEPAGMSDPGGSFEIVSNVLDPQTNLCSNDSVFE
jgi:hypothetical protein